MASLWKILPLPGGSHRTQTCRAQRGFRGPSRPGQVPRSFLCASLLACCLTLSAAVAWADTVRLVVMFRDGTPTLLQRTIVAQSNSTVVAWLPVVQAVVLELPAGQTLGMSSSLTQSVGLGSLLSRTLSSATSAFAFLSSRLGLEIESIETDFHLSLPDDSIPKSLVGQAAPAPVQGGYRWNLRQISLDQVDQQVQGQGVKVAVLDTGIDPSHPLLAGRVAGGYNARTREDVTHYMDRNGHGTHVAGLIAAAAAPSSAARVLRGVAPQALLYGVRVLDANGKGYLSDVVNGLIWVYQQHDIRVVNMSLGFYNGSKVIEKIIKKLYDAGVVLVASSGNCDVTAASSEGGDSEGGDSEGGDSEGGDSEGGDSEGGDSVASTRPEGCQTREIKYPAVYWRTIAVGATDADARVTYYSITGSHVDIVAPGGTHQKRQIVSTATTVSVGTKHSPTSTGDNSQGAASEGGDSEGGDSEGGDSEGGDSEGGDSEGGDSEGGDSEGGDSEGGDGVISRSSGLYAVARGTSQAAPHVAGVVALMRSVNPSLTPAQIQTILRDTAIDLGAPAAAQGAGLINAARAVERARSLR